jgi:hypothetical protein
MSIPLTGTGGLFTQLGVIGALIYRENLQQNTLNTRFNNLPAQYAEPNNDLIAPILPSAQSYAQIPSQMASQLQALAQNTLTRAVFNDQPAQSGSLQSCLQELIRQMIAGSATVNQCSVSCSAAAQGTLNGDGIMVASSLGGNGLPLENIVAEVMPSTCTADAQTGGQNVGNEQFTVLGQPVGSDHTWYLWPQGSAASKTLNAISALNNNSANNLLVNGGFDAFTSNVPNNWVLSVGTAGTDVLMSTSTVYSGASSLELVGNASGTGVKAALYQQFGASSTGTSAKLAPATPYNFAFRLRVATVPAAGVISVQLVGGSSLGSMSVLTDAQGNNCSVAFSLTGLTNNTWTAVSGTLRTPLVLPAVYALQVAVTTAISTSTNAFVDHLAFAAGQQLYSGGPFANMFSGATPFIQGDRWLLTNSNNYAGSTYGASFQPLFNRLFAMAKLGLLLPSTSGGGGSISDSLITT